MCIKIIVWSELAAWYIKYTINMRLQIDELSVWLLFASTYDATDPEDWTQHPPEIQATPQVNLHIIISKHIAYSKHVCTGQTQRHASIEVDDILPCTPRVTCLGHEPNSVLTFRTSG